MKSTEAEASLREGRLEDALGQLQDRVKKDPSNAELRVFLFQLLAVMGQWDRARNQLRVVSEMKSDTNSMSQTYDLAIRCERLREEIFAGRKAPLIFGQPEEWIAQLIQALQLDGQGHHGEARDTRLAALEDAPAVPGRVKPRDSDTASDFEWLADGDTRIGPIFEAIMDGKYYWVPMNRVAQIGIDKPEDLRDFIWIPVGFTFANGGQKIALMPSRYVGSGSATDSGLRLGRKTEWAEAGENLYEGQGQRMWMTDQGEHGCFDLSEIEFDLPTEEEPDGTDG